MAAPRGREASARDDWRIWSTDASIVVGAPEAVPAARRIADEVLAEVTAAASRFDDASELWRVARDPGTADGVTVSPLFAELVSTALRVAEFTGGSVDPTLGSDLVALGYDRDFSELPRPSDVIFAERMTGSIEERPPGWRRVRITGTALTMPVGTLLDLGATAKAWAADSIARRCADELGAPVLVGLGGDLSAAGPADHPGWEIHVQDLDSDPAQQVLLPLGNGMATSSTQKRRWQHGGQPVHHILDPAFGSPVVPAWRSVTVAARSCVRANALSTAAIVRGRSAVAWLQSRGADARLVDLDGRIVKVGGWPEPAAAGLTATAPAGAGVRP
jgi:thiamine biosynthesis lipoprotein